MTQQTDKTNFIDRSRCAHRFANGMRCRLRTPNEDSSYCANHATLVENRRTSTDTAASLTADLTEFRSAIPINEFLARLLLLLAQDRISPRKAAVLAYITNQLLRTLPVINAELNPKPDKDEPTQIIFDMPGPDPDPDKTPVPEPTYADLRT
jgi:hypothetical protein